MRWIVEMVLGLVLAALMFVGGAIALDGYRDWRFASSHALIDKLPENQADAGIELQRRIAALFLPGSDSQNLEKYLAGEGFGVVPGRDGAVTAQLTKLGNLHFIGRRDWIVSWTRDINGQVRALDAKFRITMS